MNYVCDLILLIFLFRDQAKEARNGETKNNYEFG